MKNIQNKRNNTPSPIRSLFRFVRNVTIIVLLLAVCFVGAVVLLHKDQPAVNQAELESVKAGLEKALAQPVWHLRHFKDPMEDISYTRLEIESTEVIGALIHTPRLSLECSPDKKGNKSLYLSMSFDQRLTLEDVISLSVKFDDAERSSSFEFSASQNGKDISPRKQEEFILKFLTSNRMRGEMYSTYLGRQHDVGTGFFSFIFTPQEMAQKYVKDCWGDYTLRPESVDINIARLIWGAGNERIAAYQKAMKAVSLYSGDANGTPDASLYQAIQKFAAARHLREAYKSEEKSYSYPTVSEAIEKETRMPADVRGSF